MEEAEGLNECGKWAELKALEGGEGEGATPRLTKLSRSREWRYAIATG